MRNVRSMDFGEWLRAPRKQSDEMQERAMGRRGPSFQFSHLGRSDMTYQIQNLFLIIVTSDLEYSHIRTRGSHPQS